MQEQRIHRVPNLQALDAESAILRRPVSSASVLTEIGKAANEGPAPCVHPRFPLKIGAALLPKRSEKRKSVARIAKTDKLQARLHA